jgi:poly-gamma-glutamate capsule biosynthesis protein CapA/YwtB (metallophosphatase superfamily)
MGWIEVPKDPVVGQLIFFALNDFVFSTRSERLGDRRRAKEAVIEAAGWDAFRFGGCTSS